MANCVVIGSNRGIGLELVRLLSTRDGVKNVVAVCRKSSEALSSVSTSDAKVKLVEGVDCANEDDIKLLSGKIIDAIGSGEKIDMFLHNAGIFKSKGKIQDNVGNAKFGSDLLEEYKVNSVAPVLTIMNCLDLFKSGSKVGLITSRVGSCADNGSGANYGYRMSKAALNMSGVTMSVDLKPHGIHIGLLHPGLVETNMTSDFGVKAGVTPKCVSPNESAACIIKVMDILNAENSGTFWHAITGEVLPW